METRHDQHSSVLLRLGFAGGWYLLTLMVAAYAVLKPKTTAADLSFLPNPIIAWLDSQFNFRTFLMVFLVCGLPAIMLSQWRWDSERRWLLTISLIVLCGFECAQIWIPTRGFSWQDMAYTAGGVLAAEGCARGWRVMFHRGIW